MSEGHTPGPWHASRATRESDGGWDYCVRQEGSRHILAEAFEVVGFGARLPAEANARLIAAAPEMYEALLHAKANMPHPDQMIDDALAKASGKEPAKS